MPATDALAHKIRFLEDHDCPDGYRFITAFGQSAVGSVTGEHLGDLYPADEEVLFDPPTLIRSVQMAEVFYLAPLMNDLVLAAAESLPNDDTIRADDAPTPSGWLYLPKPISLIDIRRRRMRFHAVHWRRRSAGYDLYWLSARTDPEDDVSALISEIERTQGFRFLPQTQFGHVTRLDDGQTMPTTITFDPSARVAPGTQLGVRSWIDDEGHRQVEWLAPPGVDVEPADAVIEPESTTRFLVAAWRLMQQTLTTLDVDDTARKGLRRDAHRANVPDTRITVVNLRRRESHGDGTTTVEWTHRWITRGHWRRQPYKDPDTNEVIHRTIWIAAYIKGPEDLPLLIRDKVYALVH